MNLCKLIFLCLLVGIAILGANANDAKCNYQTYKWNTLQKKVVQVERISKPYFALNETEVHKETGCTVCEQDQITINLEGLAPFKLCKVIADDVRSIIVKLIEQNQPIYTVIGYRVGKTRGDIDLQGNRTQFSNHSFGVSIDINSEYNGLYDRCIVFNSNCRLIKGGAWLPGDNPASITKESLTVKMLEELGLKWGGEIVGNQKDFMHFSPSGY